MSSTAFVDGSAQAASFELGLALEKHGEWRFWRHFTSFFLFFRILQIPLMLFDSILTLLVLVLET